MNLAATHLKYNWLVSEGNPVRIRPTKVQIVLLGAAALLLIAAVGSSNRQTTAQPVMPADQAHFVPNPQPVPNKPAADISYVVVVKPLAKGTVITKDSIELRHTENSLGGAVIESVESAIGRRVTRNLKAGDPLQPGDIVSIAKPKKAKH